jgi:hypothetical protein
MKLIEPNQHYLPKNYCQNPRLNTDTVVYYLAGPILGGGLWQEQAIDFLTKTADPKAVIACPLRFQEPHHFARLHTQASGTMPSQLHWEQHYMNLASLEGCLIFWLPKESQTHPRTDGRPYAMMTRDELSTWRTVLGSDPNRKVVLGIEDGFPGKEEAIWLISYFLTDGILPVHNTLEETLLAGIQKSK